MKIIIAIIVTLLIISTPAFAAQRSDTSTAIAPITISERCQQLQINCTRSELLQVGRKLEQLYFSRYNQKPPQQRGVNIYTNADSNLIDQALITQLATENEKLRKDLEVRQRSPLRKGQ
ncbi:hypothetical protein [Iningainema tapete]|uniref:Uncharacterized protein n=1 Tax=Iningainema tapete BLCC-T55 TaxID=2748662 RepID=A0A8J6XTQ1_9CYAN|nr:hypothetical protein [Iningainema tapete]MBD2778279.1 hypothetical protein [Iningainema tapete BLCC-T55]